MKIESSQINQVYSSQPSVTQLAQDVPAERSQFQDIQDTVEISSAARQSARDDLPLPPVNPPIDV